MQVLEVLAAAHVGDHGRPAHAAALVAEQLAEGADHPRRQVVDAEVAAVLEGGDRLRLAGARVAGDDDQVDVPDGRAVSRRRASRRPSSRLVQLPVDVAGELAGDARDGLELLAAGPTRRSGEPKCLSSARFRTGPTPRSSSSSEVVIAWSRRAAVVRRSRTGAPRRGPAAAAAAPRSRAGSGPGCERPGTKTSSIRLARPITGHRLLRRLDQRRERPHPGRRAGPCRRRSRSGRAAPRSSRRARSRAARGRPGPE